MVDDRLKKALYLDDIRTPKEVITGYESWVVVRSYNEFVDYITDNGIPDLISFDHDLADEHIADYFDQVHKMGWAAPSYDNYKEMTGLDCAKWLVEYVTDNNLKLPNCGVHSHNPVGADNIRSYINNYKKHIGESPNCYLGKPLFK